MVLIFMLLKVNVLNSRVKLLPKLEKIAKNGFSTVLGAIGCGE